MEEKQNSFYETEMKCTVHDRESLENKARIFFACHPDDFKEYFEQIVEDIDEIQKCAIYYFESDGKNHRKDIEQNLPFMNLVVIPVTEKLLDDYTGAFDSGIVFALENNISVLPIVVDEDVVKTKAKQYAKLFGDRQYILKSDHDYTAIDYKDKLSSFLELLLLDEKTAQKVRDAFDAYIFLSYRKRDRSDVNKFIDMVHSNQEFSTVAIWYDEFLTLGEDFNDSIKEAIRKSAMCTLAVTPSILESGNFILEHEYDMMRSENKYILPVELEETDKESLNKLYGITDTIPGDDQERVYEMLRRALNDIGFTRTVDDPVHDYLLGLAYLNGINTISNVNHSYNLLTSAAENGVVDAMHALVQMLKNLYVTVNSSILDHKYSDMQKWQKKYLDHLSVNAVDDPEGDANRLYIKELFVLADIYRVNLKDEKEEAKRVLARIRDITSSVKSTWAAFEYGKASRILGRMNDEQEGIEYFLDACSTYEKICSEDKSIGYLEEALNTCTETAEAFVKLNSKAAEEYYVRALRYAEEIKALYPSDEAVLLYVRTCYELGEWLIDNNRHLEARKKYESAQKQIEILLSADRSLRNLKEAMYVYSGLSRTYAAEEKIPEAIGYMETAAGIAEEIDDRKPGTYFRKKYINQHQYYFYENLEKYYSQLDNYKKQKEYYFKKQERLFSDNDHLLSINENMLFYKIALAHKDYNSVIKCWNDILRKKYSDADRYESISDLEEARQWADDFIRQSESWKEESETEIWIIKDFRKTIQDKIDFWKKCEENDMPLHRPD